MEEIVENECLFQEALNGWVQNHDKEFSDKMWFCIYECCKNMMKSKANGIIVPDLESKANIEFQHIAEAIQYRSLDKFIK